MVNRFNYWLTITGFSCEPGPRQNPVGSDRGTAYYTRRETSVRGALDGRTP